MCTTTIVRALRDVTYQRTSGNPALEVTGFVKGANSLTRRNAKGPKTARRRVFGIALRLSLFVRGSAREDSEMPDDYDKLREIAQRLID